MSITTCWTHEQWGDDVRIELTTATTQRTNGVRPGCTEVLLYYYGSELSVEIPTRDLRDLVREAGLT